MEVRFFGRRMMKSRLPLDLVVSTTILAVADGTIAAVAFVQLLRIYFRNHQLGWTRQKIFHLMIGSSNIGYLIYFMSSLLATCEGWQFWLNAFGFILIAGPQILFLSAFLLLLSFWVDLCHQAKDDEEDDESCMNENLLEKAKSKPGALHMDGRRRCCSFRNIHVGIHQKFVILVIIVVSVLMIAFALLIWCGRGKNPIDSQLMARVYQDIVSVAMLILGGVFAYYEILLFHAAIWQILLLLFSCISIFSRSGLMSVFVSCERQGMTLSTKMSNVRSEMVSAEMWKVASLTVVTLVCFTSCSVLALVTSIPVFDYWHADHSDTITNSISILFYYLIGSSVPSAFVLWIMREMPPPIAAERPIESRVVSFVQDTTAIHNPQWRATVASSQNKVMKVSPI